MVVTYAAPSPARRWERSGRREVKAAERSRRWADDFDAEARRVSAVSYAVNAARRSAFVMLIIVMRRATGRRE